MVCGPVQNQILYCKTVLGSQYGVETGAFPMARPKAKAPALSYHISGQSIVRIDSRDFYLGKQDSPESIARYAVLIGIYQAGGMSLPEDFNASTLDERAALVLGQSQAVVSHTFNISGICVTNRDIIYSS